MPLILSNKPIVTLLTVGFFDSIKKEKKWKQKK